MKELLIILSFPLIGIVLLAAAFHQPSVKTGVNDWAKMTAEQFNHR